MTGKVPLVSVIVPAYNAAGCICDAIESLKAQICRDFEAIIIDDGSTDGTYEVARLACGNDPRFVLKRQLNMGVSSARNLGLCLSSGDWVAFLDADDFFEPEYLADLFDAADNEVDLVIAGAKVVGHRERLLSNYERAKLGREELRSLSQRLLDEQSDGKTKCNLDILGCICSKLYRRHSLEQIRFDERIRMREDAVFNLEVFCKVRSAAVITSCGYVYRLTPETASLSFHPNYDKEIDAFCEECMAVWEREGLPAESFHRGVLYLYMSWLKLYALHPNNSFTWRQRRKLIAHSFEEEKWKRSFKALENVKLSLPYGFLRAAFLAKSAFCVAALKCLNDMKRGLIWE